MKRLSLIVAGALITVGVAAQKPVMVEGKLDKARLSDIKLFATVEGTPVMIASATPNEKGLFGFSFYPATEGFYMMGTGTGRNPQHMYTFYLKPGDKLKVAINDSAYHLVGKGNSAESMVMQQWFNLSYPLMRRSVYFDKYISTYEDYFPLFNRMTPTLLSFISKVKTPNPVFNKIGKTYLEADLSFIAFNFLRTPRLKHPGADVVMPDFYTKFDIGKFTADCSLYQFPIGIRMLSNMVAYNMRPVYQQDKDFAKNNDVLAREISFVVNDTLKGELVLNGTDRIKTYTAYLDFLAANQQYLVTESQQKRAFDKQAALADFKPGMPGFNFTYPDVSGTPVSLASFKGKVVLVDTWATWCSPCKKEIPHLKKLEEELAGKDVAIVSISVDEEKDKDKWKDFIVQEQLGGTQLFAKGWSEITKFYQITGIPRFLLFDKEGNLITHQAPRPSNPELKKLIEKYM